MSTNIVIENWDDEYGIWDRAPRNEYSFTSDMVGVNTSWSTDCEIISMMNTMASDQLDFPTKDEVEGIWIPEGSTPEQVAEYEAYERAMGVIK